MPRADVSERDAGPEEDGGGRDAGAPRLPVRSTHTGVASGRVSSSARYRLVLSTASSGSTASPSSSRYVLREHAIGRMAAEP